MNGGTNTLANCVSAFHLFIIIFVLAAPFSTAPYILILHITLGMSLLVHWAYNNDTCALSVIESRLRGLDYTQSYSHKFISPLYNISQTQWSHLVWTITIVAMCISAYKLYQSDRPRKAWECYKSTNSFLECARIIMH
jgi:hypothetical protein